MCEKCVRKSKHLGLGKSTYGQVKAVAQSYFKHGLFGMRDRKFNFAVESHFHKIRKAISNTKFRKLKNSIDRNEE